MNRLISFVAIALVLCGTWTTGAGIQTPAATPPATPPGPQTGGPGVATPPGRGRGFAPVVIGPSAPVPPEVAIPRPTPAELAQVGSGVQDLGAIVLTAVHEQSIANAPLMIFVVIATVLMLFMVRT